MARMQKEGYNSPYAYLVGLMVLDIEHPRPHRVPTEDERTDMYQLSIAIQNGDLMAMFRAVRNLCLSQYKRVLDGRKALGFPSLARLDEARCIVAILEGLE